MFETTNQYRWSKHGSNITYDKKVVFFRSVNERCNLVDISTIWLFNIAVENGWFSH